MLKCSYCHKEKSVKNCIYISAYKAFVCEECYKTLSNKGTKEKRVENETKKN